MKNLTTITILLIFLSSYGNAQHLGGGLNAGSETLFGFNLTYIHSLEDDFSFNLDATWFLPHISHHTYVDYITSRFEINANYQYNLSLAKFTFYPYAGLNISHITTDKNLTTTSDQRLNTTDAEFEVGLNFGSGMIIPLQNQLDVFLEGRYTFHDYDQLMIKAGVLFKL